MSEKVKVGQLCKAGAERDAIHVPICPIIAREDLQPGQPVGAWGFSGNPIGIVDPFLKEPVKCGETFYLFYTRTPLHHLNINGHILI